MVSSHGIKCSDTTSNKIIGLNVAVKNTLITNIKFNLNQIDKFKLFTLSKLNGLSLLKIAWITLLCEPGKWKIRGRKVTFSVL